MPTLTVRLKKNIAVSYRCAFCGKEAAAATLLEAARGFLTEGEKPPQPRRLMGGSTPEEMPLPTKEQARAAAEAALRREGELLSRCVNENGEAWKLNLTQGDTCPHCGKRQPWLTRSKPGLWGAVAGGVVGLGITALICATLLHRPDFIIAVGLTGCMAYGGNRFFAMLDTDRAKKAARALPKEALPRVEA